MVHQPGLTQGSSSRKSSSRGAERLDKLENHPIDLVMHLGSAD
jgi:hypothetical protein